VRDTTLAAAHLIKVLIKDLPQLAKFVIGASE
jgi:hypothetical protein